jgi:transaldolase
MRVVKGNMSMSKGFKSTLHEMTQTTSTVLWNDSCAIGELTASMETNGTVGATCNPVIVLEVLKKEWGLWKERIPALIREMPAATEDEVAWKLTEEMSVKARRC